MSDNDKPIGIEFESRGLQQVQSDLRSYQQALQQVADYQNKFAQRTMQAAQAQMQAAQSSKSAYDQQIRDAQRAYEAKTLEAREFARATREKIATYRMEATAAENGLRAQIAILKQREQAESTSAGVAAQLAKSRMALEVQLVNHRRQTETQIEAMRLRERQSLDKITAEADKFLKKRRELEDTARKEAAAQQQAINAQKTYGQTVQQVTKAVNDQLKATEKQIREQDKLAAAQQKAFKKDMLAQQKAALKASEEQAKRTTAAYGKFSDVIGTINPRLGFATKAVGNLSGSMLAMGAVAVGTIAVVLALVAGVTALGKAMYGLGVQGNQALETISTFNNVVNSALAFRDDGGTAGAIAKVGEEAKGATQGLRSMGDAFGEVGRRMKTSLSGQFLADLRKQTRGTISDIELMRLTLRALQGTTLEFRQVVAPALGEIFDATARIARATGQSADVIREKFIFGLRRMENRLLDDIGVKVDAVKANEAYAKSIGKSVEALTQQERQIAFTQEAVRQLQVAAGELGDPNATVENIARIQATIENIRLKMQLALAPFADAITSILSKAAELAMVFIDYIAPAVKVVSTNFKGLIQDLDDAGMGMEALRPVVELTAKVFLVFLALINDSITGVRAMVRAIASAPEAFNRAFLGLPKLFATLFGAIKALSKFNIEDLAYLMAYGGGAIMGAFAEGLYYGVKPVVEAVTFVANIVADFLMGFSPPKKGPLHTIDKGAFNVGKAWVDGFIGGLMEFDKRADVLDYVNERLGDIGKMNMEQVEAGLHRLDIALRPYQERLEIVKADMEAITGFIDPAVEAMERIQSRAIRALKEGGGDVKALRALDAQILSLQRIQDLKQDAIDQATVDLAMAQSRQIQERTLLMIQKRRLEMQKKGKDDKDGGKDTAGGGSGGETPADGDIGTLPGGGEFPPMDDLVGDINLPNVADDIFKGLSEGFFDVTSIDNDVSDFKSAMDKIKNADPGAGIADKLKGIVGAFGDIIEPVTSSINTIFALDENGLLGKAIINLGGFKDSVGEALLSIFGAGESTPFSLAAMDVGTWSENINLEFGEILKAVTGDGGFASQMEQTMAYVFGPIDAIDSVLGLSKSNLDGFIEGGKTAFQTFIDFLKGDFQLGATLDQTILAPIKGIIISLGGAIEDGIVGIIKGINDVLDEIPDAFGIGTIDVPTEGFITNLLNFTAAKGKLNARGLGLVGEKGPELIAPSRGVDIFPNSATRAIIRMSQMMARNPGSQIVVLPNRGGGPNNTTNTFAPTFNMSGSRENIMLRSRQLYASMV